MDDIADAVARRTIERSTAERMTAYADEIRLLIDATYRLIEKKGNLDPPMREILKAARLSTQAFYKHFRTKDELMLALLDDGRRRLLGYLQHRMAKERTPARRVRAWVEGVLAQAADPRAAQRTKPFMMNQDRLTDQFPAEQQASFDLLIDLLDSALAGLPGAKRDPRAHRRDAESIYHATFGALRMHLIHGTHADAAEIDHLVRFCIGGATSRD